MELRLLKKKIRSELITAIPLLILAILVPIAAWHGILQYGNDLPLWFQRSGSITVLFAVWVEFKLFSLSGLTNPISPNGQTFSDLKNRDVLTSKYGKRISHLKYVAAILAISGTAIWGYGDILRAL
ncbi:hypothetical protein KUV95_17095 [Microbulbifer agarilyticus]|uniref:hypothetical protein n=1 Tax=Microbulbifer agarilyticus TaxID=260552 RepID=UPI001C94F59D|nr:hypothetical protein [Microbulbifer agarilyticus]MBY6213267.1 hypothetical protein [Microbulbifer agarilyticus]